ncbi:hypothetical protein D3C80_1824710 [compost metagenome]
MQHALTRIVALTDDTQQAAATGHRQGADVLPCHQPQRLEHRRVDINGVNLLLRLVAKHLGDGFHGDFSRGVT